MTPSQSKAALCIFGRKSSLEAAQFVTVPVPLSKVSMQAGSATRQSGSSSGSCGKEILLLPAQEVVTGGWAGAREQRQPSTRTLVLAFSLPSPAGSAVLLPSLERELR